MVKTPKCNILRDKSNKCTFIQMPLCSYTRSTAYVKLGRVNVPLLEAAQTVYVGVEWH